MSVSRLRRRLDALEVRSAPKIKVPVLSPLSRLRDGLIAYHLGAVGPNESLAEGVARGLGYEKSRDLMDGLRADEGMSASDDLNARWRDATIRPFALKGAVPDCDGETFTGTLEALYRDLREGVRGHPFLAECEDLSAAA